MRQRADGASFTVRAQYLEIYTEEVRDLLAPEGTQGGSGGGIAIRECPDGQIVVTGAGPCPPPCLAVRRPSVACALSAPGCEPAQHTRPCL